MPDTNKVVLGDEVLIDLTSDTVSADNMLQGTTAHDASGRSITGAVVVAPIDDEISFESENPVQNKVIALALDGKDAKPTELTKAEYDALSEDKKKQGEYFITDWKPEVGGGSLETLSDVNIENPDDKQALVYDAKTGMWVNGEAVGDSSVTLTKEEFDALPEDEKNKGTYFIKDWSQSGGGGDSGKEITKAEYDAMSEEEKNNGDYYINDWSETEDLQIKNTVQECINSTSTEDVAGASAIAELSGNLSQLSGLFSSRFEEYTSGSMHDIRKSGVYFLGNSVTDKPNGSGGGTFGLYVCGVYSNGSVAGLFVPYSLNYIYAVSSNGTTWTTKKVSLS